MLRVTDEAFIRMEQEEKELADRTAKLEDFIRNARLNKVHDITLEDIKLLEEQRYYMCLYLYTLRIRIARVRGESNGQN